MTLGEAFQQGILKVRLPVWNKFAYVEIIKTNDGYMAPIVKLWDVGCPGQELVAAFADCPDFVAWQQPVDDWRPEVYKTLEEQGYK